MGRKGGEEEGRGRSEPSLGFQTTPEMVWLTYLQCPGPLTSYRQTCSPSQDDHTSIFLNIWVQIVLDCFFSVKLCFFSKSEPCRMSLMRKGPHLFSEGHVHLQPRASQCLSQPIPIISCQPYGKGSLLVSRLSLRFRHQGARLPSQAGALPSRPRSPRHPALPRFQATSWHLRAKPKFCLCLEKCRSESQMCQPYYHHQQTS